MPGSGSTWRDATGNFTVNLIGSPTWARQARSGLLGVSMDGVDDHAIPTSNIGITGNAEFTVALWMTFRSTAVRGIMGWGTTGGALTAFGLWYGAGGSNLISAEYAGGNNCYCAGRTVAGDTPICIIYTKVAGAIAANSKFYFDGVDGGTVTGSANTPNMQNGEIRIGKWADYNAADSYSYSEFEQAMVWNRALSAGEAKQLYDSFR